MATKTKSKAVVKADERSRLEGLRKRAIRLVRAHDDLEYENIGTDEVFDMAVNAALAYVRAITIVDEYPASTREE